MAITNTKKSAFYVLLEKFNEDIGVSSLYPSKPGREAGQTTLSDEVEAIIGDAVEKCSKVQQLHILRFGRKLGLNAVS